MVLAPHGSTTDRLGRPPGLLRVLSPALGRQLLCLLPVLVPPVPLRSSSFCQGAQWSSRLWW